MPGRYVRSLGHRDRQVERSKLAARMCDKPAALLSAAESVAYQETQEIPKPCSRKSDGVPSTKPRPPRRRGARPINRWADVCDAESREIDERVYPGVTPITTGAWNKRGARFLEQVSSCLNFSKVGRSVGELRACTMDGAVRSSPSVILNVTFRPRHKLLPLPTVG